jgi:hypothetical protein
MAVVERRDRRHHVDGPGCSTERGVDEPVRRAYDLVASAAARRARRARSVGAVSVVGWTV